MYKQSSTLKSRRLQPPEIHKSTEQYCGNGNGCSVIKVHPHSAVDKTQNGPWSERRLHFHKHHVCEFLALVRLVLCHIKERNYISNASLYLPHLHIWSRNTGALAINMVNWNGMCFCTNPVIIITLQAAIGVDGVEFWDEDDDLWVRNEAVLNDRPSSSSSLLLGDCWPDEDDLDRRCSSLTLSFVRICSSIWIFNMMVVGGYSNLNSKHSTLCKWKLPIIIDH